MTIWRSFMKHNEWNSCRNKNLLRISFTCITFRCVFLQKLNSKQLLKPLRSSEASSQSASIRFLGKMFHTPTNITMDVVAVVFVVVKFFAIRTPKTFVCGIFFSSSFKFQMIFFLFYRQDMLVHSFETIYKHISKHQSQSINLLWSH